MSQRVAVLMKLREGVTQSEVKELCNLLRRIGEPSWLASRGTETYINPVLGDKRIRFAPNKDRPKTDEELVDRYNDEHGDPTFYIP